MGGVHATLNPEECAHSADVVCVGEGEGMIVDLVSRLETGADWRKVLNAAYLEQGILKRNPLRPLTTNMDALPLLDFSCSDEFHLQNGKLARVAATSAFTREEIPFIASRGCVFHCSYCCNARLKQVYEGTGSYVRKHSVSEAVRRIATLHTLHFPKGKYVFFVDDDFLDRTTAELQQFATTFPVEVGLPFECNVSPLRVTKERIKHLVEAGVWRIRMGVESGSERTKRDVYKRAMPNRAVVKASEILSQYPNVVRAYYFIIGNPFEKQEDLLETVKLISELPEPFFAQMFNLIFFPGSVLYDDALAAGYITGKSDSGYNLHYREGLVYEKHLWKQKNLYLNALLFLMEGKITRTRLGAIPRFLLPVLTKPSIIELNIRHNALAKAMVMAKLAILKIRTLVGRTVKRLVPNPRIIYNPTDFAKRCLGKVLLWQDGV